MKKHRRAVRRDTTPIEVSNLSSAESMVKIARSGKIIEASVNGLLMHVKREDIVPRALKNSLNIDAIIGDEVYLHLPQMDLEISGKIARTKFLGKAGYEIAIDYSQDAPEYWRECLFDLLPAPGELDDH